MTFNVIIQTLQSFSFLSSLLPAHILLFVFPASYVLYLLPLSSPLLPFPFLSSPPLSSFVFTHTYSILEWRLHIVKAKLRIGLLYKETKGEKSQGNFKQTIHCFPPRSKDIGVSVSAVSVARLSVYIFLSVIVVRFGGCFHGQLVQSSELVINIFDYV